MKEIKCFCDLCKKEVEALDNYTFPGYIKSIYGMIFFGEEFKGKVEVELCDECADKIREYLNIHQ